MNQANKTPNTGETEQELPKVVRDQSGHLSNAMKTRKPVFNPMGRVEDVGEDETIIADVRRHPIGLFLVYLGSVIVLGIAFVLLFAYLPGILESSNRGGSLGGTAVALVFSLFASLFTAIYLYIATKIYNANQLIITDEHVTQINQMGLFNRKVSEVSMENIEDVSAHQNGVLSTVFNYGRLHIETAGEQDNYNFLYCPRPSAYAKCIQDARITFVKKKHYVDAGP